MRLGVASLAVLAVLPLPVLGGGQIPAVNGIIGGVPSALSLDSPVRILITDPIPSGAVTTLPPDTTTEPTYTATTLDPVTETDTDTTTTSSMPSSTTSSTTSSSIMSTSTGSLSVKSSSKSTSSTPSFTSASMTTATIPTTTLTAALNKMVAPVTAVRIVENSGICETTPGVYQASGYVDLSATEHIWFWFFGARKHRRNAPLVLWFNGGPGSSSMIGLFQENGPCRIKNDSSTVVNNPYSWNDEANVIYIDQPVGVGFSYGNLNVGTSDKAARDVWRFMQILLSDPRFSQYSRRPLGIWTESYGGHYGPSFAAYFLRQNSLIRKHRVAGKILRLKALGIGNGLTDPLAQYPEYLTYAGSNPYHPLVPTATIAGAQPALISCKNQISMCYAGATNAVCSAAQSYCNANIMTPLIDGWDVYDVRQRSPDPYPPDFSTYINSIRSAIGAVKIWTKSNFQVYINFAATGDWMRNSRPLLEQVINAGVRTLIYAGDADYIVNYRGVEAMVDKLNTKFTAQYKTQGWSNYKVSGIITGQFKQAGTFSYLRVFGAGHEVPAYGNNQLAPGEAALQFFKQITSDHSLS